MDVDLGIGAATLIYYYSWLRTEMSTMTLSIGLLLRLHPHTHTYFDEVNTERVVRYRFHCFKTHTGSRPESDTPRFSYTTRKTLSARHKH